MHLLPTPWFIQLLLLIINLLLQLHQFFHGDIPLKLHDLAVNFELLLLPLLLPLPDSKSLLIIWDLLSSQLSVIIEDMRDCVDIRTEVWIRGEHTADEIVHLFRDVLWVFLDWKVIVRLCDR